MNNDNYDKEPPKYPAPEIDKFICKYANENRPRTTTAMSYITHIAALIALVGVISASYFNDSETVPYPNNTANNNNKSKIRATNYEKNYNLNEIEDELISLEAEISLLENETIALTNYNM